MKAFALVLAPALLAGCATIPPPPPVTSYAGQDCASSPDLAGAISLTPEKRKRTYTVSTPVDGVTPCLDRRGHTPYILYALPLDPENKVIEVGAEIEAARIFSPAVAILDGQGNPLRSFTPDQYLYRGTLFSVQFVPQAGERYVQVTADPERIGRNRDAVAIGTSTAATWTPYGVVSWTSGIDRNVSRTFSYEGSVMAVVHDRDPEEP